MKAEGSVAEKVKQYNDANRKVAILCNHKRTVTASHANQMEKLGDRVCSTMIRWLRENLTNALLDQRSSLPKMEGQNDDARSRAEPEEEERR